MNAIANVLFVVLFFVFSIFAHFFALVVAGLFFLYALGLGVGLNAIQTRRHLEDSRLPPYWGIGSAVATLCVMIWSFYQPVDMMMGTIKFVLCGAVTLILILFAVAEIRKRRQMKSIYKSSRFSN